MRSFCQPTVRSSMARRFLHDAALALQKGVEPPALDADQQRVRAAGMLLERQAKPQEWAKVHLTDGLNRPVYTL